MLVNERARFYFLDIKLAGLLSSPVDLIKSCIF